MNSNYKINTKEKLYDGFFKLYKLDFNHQKHNGDWNNNVLREIFGGAHLGALLPYDPIKKKIVLISQFRAGLFKRNKNPLSIEITAGIIDEGEMPIETAKRECMEESGCEAKNILEVCSYYPAPGSSESFYHLFLGEVNAFEGERIMGQKNENEDILVKCYDVEEVREFLKKKQIINGLTLIALQWFFLEYYKS